MRRMVLIFSLLLLAPLASLTAQEAPSLAPGARVRVSSRWQGSETGTLVALKVDSLVLNVKGRRTPLAIPLASVSKLEVSRGRGRVSPEVRAQKVMLGAIVGSLFCGVIGWYSPLCQSTDANPYAILLLIVPGASVGGVLGARTGGDRWEPVPLPVRVGVAPQRHGGVRLAASFAF